MIHAQGDPPLDEQFAAELRKMLTLAATTSTLAAPLGPSRLLEMIVEIAAQLLAARAASLLLVDEAKRDLVFEVALGPKGEEVKEFRIPLGHGIAGLVALSGEALTVSDLRQDPRSDTDIARAVGYWPDNVLCVPLLSNDQVIGVLEVFDKEGASSFSTVDVEVLGLFGNLAAVAIEQSRTHRNLTRLITEVLASYAGAPQDQQGELQRDAQSFLTRLEEDDATYRRTLQLARLVQEIGERGDREVQICQTILGGFLDYLRSGPGQLSHGPRA